MAYHEIALRGTHSFPNAYYFVDKNHTRYHMAAHWHTDLEVILVRRGELLLTLGDKEYRVRAGQAVFIGPEQVHRGEPRGAVYECIVFSPDWFYEERFDTEGFLGRVLKHKVRIRPLFSAEDGEAHRALSAFFSEMGRENPCRLSVLSALCAFFAAVKKDALYQAVGEESDPVSQEQLKKALLFLREHYDRELSLSDMAASVGLSAGHFGRFFKKMTGKTPVSYLNEYRVEKAARALRGTSRSVTEIALSSGFSDLSYFIKTFKKYKGISPLRFRNQ